ncbi:hypothetical protein AINA4_12090 [Aurantimicrobium sp. INA4]|nr:hypothetical protein AINA4_12090 [Aurantimicrobium sp. INA4]
MDNFLQSSQAFEKILLMTHTKTRRLDMRLFIGLALVVGAALGGFALVTATESTTAVYVASKTLTPGHVLDKNDLVLTDVKLGSSGTSYLTANAFTPGSVVTKAVGAGELVPVSAVGTAKQVATTNVVVQLDVPLASEAVVGTSVDVWASMAAGQGVFGPPSVIISGAQIAHITEATGLAASNGGVRVELVVPQNKVAALLESQANGDALSLVPTRGKSS